MTHTVLHANCLDILNALPENSLDGVLTDAPYGLSAPPDIAEVMRCWVSGEKYEHGGNGFMNRVWDAFVPGPDIWKAVHRALKPGAYCLVFAGSRTQDLMSISMRFGGLEIRDCMLAWNYLNGFPKSVNMDGGYGSALKPAYEPIIVARKPLVLGLEKKVV